MVSESLIKRIEEDLGGHPEKDVRLQLSLEPKIGIDDLLETIRTKPQTYFDYLDEVVVVKVSRKKKRVMKCRTKNRKKKNKKN